MRQTIISTIVFALLALLCSSAQADPQVFTYSGILVDAESTPFQGTVDVTFEIQTAADEVLWGDTWEEHEVADGWLFVELGTQAVLEIDWAADEVYALHIWLGEEYLGSQNINSTPLATVASGATGELETELAEAAEQQAANTEQIGTLGNSLTILESVVEEAVSDLTEVVEFVENLIEASGASEDFGTAGTETGETVDFAESLLNAIQKEGQTSEEAAEEAAEALENSVEVVNKIEEAFAPGEESFDEEAVEDFGDAMAVAAGMAEAASEELTQEDLEALGKDIVESSQEWDSLMDELLEVLADDEFSEQQLIEKAIEELVENFEMDQAIEKTLEEEAGGSLSGEEAGNTVAEGSSFAGGMNDTMDGEEFDEMSNEEKGEFLVEFVGDTADKLQALMDAFEGAFGEGTDEETMADLGDLLSQLKAMLAAFEFSYPDIEEPGAAMGDTIVIMEVFKETLGDTDMSQFVGSIEEWEAVLSRFKESFATETEPGNAIGGLLAAVGSMNGATEVRVADVGKALEAGWNLLAAVRTANPGVEDIGSLIGDTVVEFLDMTKPARTAGITMEELGGDFKELHSLLQTVSAANPSVISNIGSFIGGATNDFIDLTKAARTAGITMDTLGGDLKEWHDAIVAVTTADGTISAPGTFIGDAAIDVAGLLETPAANGITVAQLSSDFKEWHDVLVAFQTGQPSASNLGTTIGDRVSDWAWFLKPLTDQGINAGPAGSALQVLVSALATFQDGGDAVPTFDDGSHNWADIEGIPGVLDRMGSGGEVFFDQHNLVFEGINVQIRNGEGALWDPRPTDDGGDGNWDPGDELHTSLNGRGNLIVGYNERTGHGPLESHEGSHNLIVGPFHGYNTYGAIMGGVSNRAFGPNVIVAGRGNHATGEFSAIVGGEDNRAFCYGDAILGGHTNSTGWGGTSCDAPADEATERHHASIVGGTGSSARVPYAVAVGGRDNKALGEAATVCGGYDNRAHGIESVVGGGDFQVNHADRTWRGQGTLFPPPAE